MELRRFWQVLRRRWLLVLIPALAVLVLGLLTYRRPAPVYTTWARFIAGQTPTPGTDLKDEQRYYNWLTSEYIVNGLTDWVRGGEFAAAVSGYVAAKGQDIPATAIQTGLTADNARSMLTLSLSGDDARQLALMMEGVISVLTTQNAVALPQLGGENALLTQLDEAAVTPAPPSLRSRLELPLRLVLALLAGVGLALLVEYLDPTLRDRREVQELGLAILGEIPEQGGRRVLRLMHQMSDEPGE
jgi:capsular polysaccharide biosynthesis protein